MNQPVRSAALDPRRAAPRPVRLVWLTVLPLAAMLLVSAAWAQPVDTLAKVKRTGTLVIGTRDSSAPLAYTTGAGRYVGYHVDICNRIGEAVRGAVQLPKIELKHQLVTSQNRVPLVTNGTVDIECGSTTNNAGRAKEVAFAPTTYVTKVRIAVKANSGITSIAQLSGKTVSTTTGTTSVLLMRKHERAAKADIRFINGKDHADSFLLLETGRVDAFVMDDNILAGLIVNSKEPSAYKIVGETLSEEPIAIMYRKDDPAFKAVVDGEVKKLMASGELAKIYARWFTAPIPPRGAIVGFPMGDTLKKAIARPNDDPAESYVK